MPTEPPLDLNPPPGARVLITGGASGIGRATADAYAARGARICILDRVARVDTPADWVCVRGSATSAEDTEKAFAEMDQRWGGVDVAFANAGMASNKPTLELTSGPLKRLEKITPPGYRAQIDLTISDDFPLAQAIVIISAVPA